MHDSLDSYLVKKYPKIFVGRYKNMEETAMCWGFECGNGWFNIINKLCSTIQMHISQIENYNRSVDVIAEKIRLGKEVPLHKKAYEDGVLIKKPVPECSATQVKEKFGTLRFYTSGSDDFIYGAISLAEDISSSTCEVCGAFGKSMRTKTGWFRTVCQKHEKNKDAKVKADISIAKPKIGSKISCLISGGTKNFVIVSIEDENTCTGQLLIDNFMSEEEVKEDRVRKIRLVKTPLFSYFDAED